MPTDWTPKVQNQRPIKGGGGLCQVRLCMYECMNMSICTDDMLTEGDTKWLMSGLRSFLSFHPHLANDSKWARVPPLSR